MKQNEYQRSAASVARRWRGKLPLLLLAILGMSGAVARGDWVATGGAVTNYTLGGTNYTAHVFLSSGPFFANSNLICDVLVVGGGGGGGETIAGGGGGGGVLVTSAFTVAVGTYAVTVGGGGSGGWGTGYPAGVKGDNSIFSTLTAIGGGAGGGYNVAASGTGGSAGGNGGNGGKRAGYTEGQGSDGGLHWNNNAGGGGGGASTNGTNASAMGGGAGGNGRAVSFSGRSAYYGGGGGGGTRNTTGPDAGLGGLGGGGAGGRTTAGQDGVANTGGGGGGGGYVSDLAGGMGGSGIVIVRYVAVPVTITAPVVTNAGATNVGHTTVSLQGQVTDIGGEIPNAWFEWWEVGSAATTTVTMATQWASFSTPLLGLTKGTSYQYRVGASNSVGSAWSDVVGFTTQSGAANYYVAASGSGVGSSWPHAFTEVQTALDAALDGDTIYIRGGNYEITNELTWTRSGVTIRGAYEGITETGPGAFDVAQWPSVLTRPSSAAANRILLISGVTSGSMDRLTLRDGKHSGYGTQGTMLTHTGGACVAILRCADLRLSALTVSGGNMVSWQPLAAGAGLFIVNSTNVTLADCLVQNNHGVTQNNDRFRGSGLYAANTSLIITNCTFRNNSGGFHSPTGVDWGVLGSGLYLSDCQAIVEGSTIWANLGYGHSQPPRGIGAYVLGGTNRFRNCLIAGNDNRVNVYNALGDGVYLQSGRSSFENCSIIRNNGQGVYYAGGFVTVTNCILWDNMDDLVNFPTSGEGVLPDVWTSCIENGDNDGINGCFAEDPLFERGLYLAANSPCVGAGGGTVEAAGLSGLTTRADGTVDTGPVDLGYHFPNGILASPLAELHVSPAGDDAHAGTSWNDALRSVTKALALATHGTRIHIAAGLYNTTVETFPLTVNHFGVELLGTNASATTFLGPAGENAMGLLIRGLHGVRVEGLTFANHGNHSVDQPYKGGGAAISHSRVLIDSCIFRDSTLSGYHSNLGLGAGLWMKDSFLTLTNCAVYGNKTPVNGNGGGIYVLNGELMLLDSVVSNNYAGVSGGGLCVSGNRGGSRHLVSNCLFDGNWLAASKNGAGLYLNATSRVQNCIITANRAPTGFGAGACVDGGDVTLKNCTVVGNSPEGVRQNGVGNLLTFRNSILWNNGDDLASSDLVSTLSNTWYCDIEDGDNVGTNGCISADPLFANPTSDWHLQSYGGRWTPGGIFVRDAVTSPCIDAGDRQDDYALETAHNGHRINMGAYGNTPQASRTYVPEGTLILFR